MLLTLLGAPGSGKGTQGRLLAERLGLSYVSSGDLLRGAISRGTEIGRQAQPYVEHGRLVPDGVLVPLMVGEIVSFLDAPDAPAREPVFAGRSAGPAQPRHDAGGTVPSRLDIPAARPPGPPGVVIDGFPRTQAQAVALDTTRSACAVKGALFLKVPDEVVIERLATRLICDGCGASYNPVAKPPRRAATCDTCDRPLSRRTDDDPETVRHRLSVYVESAQPLLSYYRSRGCLVEVDGDGPEERVGEQLLRAVRRIMAEAQASAA